MIREGLVWSLLLFYATGYFLISEDYLFLKRKILSFYGNYAWIDLGFLLKIQFSLLFILLCFQALKIWKTNKTSLS
jgi:hypothetical protein